MRPFRFNPNNPDHWFGLVIVTTAPLLAVILIGLFGGGA